MSTKRPREDHDGEATGGGAAPDTKKPRHGFRVGPENLPDGPWRRKVTKIKKDLIHKAKVKKAFAKVKAAEEQESQDSKKKSAVQGDGGEQEQEEGEEEEEPQIHPERQAMLDDPDADAQEEGGEQADADGRPRRRNGGARSRQRRDPRRPGYYDKALEQAEKRRQDAEARAAEAKRREDERNRRVAERERYRRAMAKARPSGGQRKLGRESGVLLDKVKRLVGQ